MQHYSAPAVSLGLGEGALFRRKERGGGWAGGLMILRGRTLLDFEGSDSLGVDDFEGRAFGRAFAGPQVGAHPAAGAAGPALPAVAPPAAGAAGATAMAKNKAKAKAAPSAGATPATPTATGVGGTPEALRASPQQPGSAEKAQSQSGADSQPGAEPTSATKNRRGAGGAGTLNKAETRGRKPKDLSGSMQKLAQELRDAHPQAPLYWGTEARTGMKLFDKLNKDVQDRIKKTMDADETLKLRVMLKHTSAIYNVLNIVNTNGLDTQEFADQFDMQQTSCQLEPVVKVEWPPHVLWSRHRMRIGSMELADPWFQMISSESLRENGISNVGLEQDKLLGERVMSLLKQSNYKALARRANELID